VSSFLRSYVAPLLAVLIFGLALLAVSARIFLPGDMVAPAPIPDDIATETARPDAIAPSNRS